MSRSRRTRLSAATAAALLTLFHVTAAQEARYRTIDNYFALPDGRKIGSTVGITIDRDGTSLWAFERCGAQNCAGSSLAPVLKFDQSAALVKSFDQSGIPQRHHDRQRSRWEGENFHCRSGS